MPATIDLLPRKEFKITLDNGTVINGKFGTWALKRFCTKKGYSLSQLGEKLTSSLDIDDMVEFVLSAVEQSHRESKTKEPFVFNDVDVCAWFDDLGGIASEQVTNLFNHAAGEQEKKSEQEQP